VLDPCEVPDQPGDRVGLGGRAGVEVVRAEPLDRRVDLFVDTAVAVDEDVLGMHTAHPLAGRAPARAEHRPRGPYAGTTGAPAVVRRGRPAGRSGPFGVRGGARDAVPCGAAGVHPLPEPFAPPRPDAVTPAVTRPRRPR